MSGQLCGSVFYPLEYDLMIISDFNCTGARDHKRAAKSIKVALKTVLDICGPAVFGCGDIPVPFDESGIRMAMARNIVARAHGSSSWTAAWGEISPDRPPILERLSNAIHSARPQKSSSILSPSARKRSLVFGDDQVTARVLGESIRRASAGRRSVYIYVDPSRRAVWETCHAVALADPSHRVNVTDLPPEGAARNTTWKNIQWPSLQAGPLCDVAVVALDSGVSQEMADAMDAITRSGRSVVFAYADYPHIKGRHLAACPDSSSSSVLDAIMERLFAHAAKVFLAFDNSDQLAGMTAVMEGQLTRVRPPVGNSWAAWTKESEQLASALADADYGEVPSLAQAQGLLARMRGYANWHALERSWA